MKRPLMFAVALLGALLLVFLFYGKPADQRIESVASENTAPSKVSDLQNASHTGDLPLLGDSPPPPAAPNTPPLRDRMLVLPAIDLPAAEADAKAREVVGIYRFASPLAVDLHPGNAGTWSVLADRRERWQLTLESPNALSLNFGFSAYDMPTGGELVLLDNEGAQPWRAFTEQDNEAHGQLWTPVVAGAAATLRVTLPAGTREHLTLQLASVNQGFRGWKKINHGKIGGDRSGSCNIDVVCDADDYAVIGPLIEPFRDQIRSVGAYTLNGIDTCSGALVANTSGDTTPYFLTADHCGINIANAGTMVCYWNFEHPTCRAIGSAANGSTGSGALAQFNSGAIFRAGYGPSDMTLVEFDDPVDQAHNVFFAGWDRTGNNASQATAIHHPAVAEKRISFELQSTTITSYFGASAPGDSTHLRIADWDFGTTEGGSSGSPLFDQNKRIIGQLHGGDAACGNNSPDWYGRLFTSWEGGGTAATRLRDWLDPAGTGMTIMDGYNNDETLNIADATTTEGDAGTSVLGFVITLSSPSTQIVTFDVLTQDGTAGSGDYNGFSAIPVTLLPGQVQQTVQVGIVGDTAMEDDETFQVRLQNAVNAGIGDDTAIGTILNDDFATPPVITSALTVTGLENTAFSYQITAQNTPTAYAVTNAPAGLTVDAMTGLVEWPAPLAGDYSFQISAVNPAGSDTRTLMLTIAPDTLLSAVDNDDLTILSGSDWFLQTATTHDGVDAAQSGPITHAQTSTVSLAFTGGPDDLTFWWKVSSEEGWDILRVLLDGVVQEQISGEIDWQPGGISIPGGSHTVSFQYVKDGSVSAGQDAGFIDELLLGSQSPLPIFTEASDASGFAGVPFNLQVSATADPTAFTATNLPPGLAIDNNGLISGAAATAGVYQVGLEASNASGTGTAEIVITIFSPVEEGADTTGLQWTVFSPPWFTQTSISHDGVDAVQSGDVRDNESSQMAVTIKGPGLFRWWWQVSSELNFDTLSVALDGTTLSNLTISGAVSWRQETISIPSGIHQVSWTYAKDESVAVGADAGWVDQVRFVSSNLVLGDAVEAPALEWLTGGDTAWFAQSTNTHDGVDALQSGAIGDGQRSWFQTTVQGPGTVGFWWSSDSAPGDRLQFMINAAVQTNITGAVVWQRVEFPLVPGNNSLRWDYIKDAALTNGRDAVWVDELSLGGYAGWIDQGLGTAAAYSVDADGDGVSNLSEYGLNDIIDIHRTNGFFMIDMPKPSWGPVGLNYQLEIADDLVTQNWNTNFTETVEDSATFFRARDTRPAGSLLQQHFRVRVVPAP